MRRRELVISLGIAALARPMPVRAQEKAMPVIGYLNAGVPGFVAQSVSEFRHGLSETGYLERQNVRIEYRYAEGHYERLPALAADLVGRKVDVLVTLGGTTVALAAKRATSTIPIVFIVGGDPIGDGLVDSLARPSGNLTGATIITVELVAKRVELLSELVPQVRVIALLVNRANSLFERM